MGDPLFRYKSLTTELAKMSALGRTEITLRSFIYHLNNIFDAAVELGV